MKLEEFLVICKEVSDNPNLSAFHKKFIELILKSTYEQAEKLMKALPDTIKEIEELRRLK